MTSTPPRRPSPSAAARPREAVGFARKRPGPLYGVKAVGSFLPGLTRKAFEKYGFSTASLVTDWATITQRFNSHEPVAELLGELREGPDLRPCIGEMIAVRVPRAPGPTERATSSTVLARSSSASTPISATRRLPSCIVQAPSVSRANAAPAPPGRCR
jgi:hypothetical protein